MLTNKYYTHIYNMFLVDASSVNNANLQRIVNKYKIWVNALEEVKEEKELDKIDPNVTSILTDLKTVFNMEHSQE